MSRDSGVTQCHVTLVTQCHVTLVTQCHKGSCCTLCSVKQLAGQQICFAVKQKCLRWPFLFSKPNEECKII